MLRHDHAGDSAELIVLSLLEDGASYGYAIAKEVAAKSDGRLRLTAGVLYPLLKKLETQGLIVSTWEEVRASDAAPGESGRRRKWYRLSAQGRRRLTQRVAAHRAYRAIIDAFIGAATPRGEEGGS